MINLHKIAEPLTDEMKAWTANVKQAWGSSIDIYFDGSILQYRWKDVTGITLVSKNDLIRQRINPSYQDLVSAFKPNMLSGKLEGL